MIDTATRALVIARAGSRCEYCRVPQSAFPFTFNLDHVLASQHVCDDSPSNLALACTRCNLKKGPNVAGIDPATRAIVPLFNPRSDKWSDHFRWNRAEITALTPVGRVTVVVLDLNSEARIAIREQLFADGGLPPRGDT